MLKAVQNYDVSLLNLFIMKETFGNERYPLLTLRYQAPSPLVKDEFSLPDDVKLFHTYANGWYEVLTEEGWALYRSDNTLVADHLKNCHVYENGWYELLTEEGYALYRDDEELVADHLADCFVYPNECYCLRTLEGWALYRYDGSLVANKINACRVCDDGTFEIKGRL